MTQRSSWNDIFQMIFVAVALVGVVTLVSLTVGAVETALQHEVYDAHDECGLSPLGGGNWESYIRGAISFEAAVRVENLMSSSSIPATDCLREKLPNIWR